MRSRLGTLGCACAPGPDTQYGARHGARGARAAGSLLQYGVAPAVRRLNEQEWMLPCDSQSKSSMERWTRRFLKMLIGYVGYVGYNNKLPYMGE